MGRTMGTGRTEPFEPPQCLPPVHPELVKRVQHLGTDNVFQAVGVLVEEFDHCNQGGSWRTNAQLRGSRTLPEKSVATVGESAIILLRAGVSLTGYVQYVFRELERLNGRRPYLMQVLGPKAVKGWLRSYNKGGKFKVLTVATYQASSDRRRLYQEMILSARQREVPVEQ